MILSPKLDDHTSNQGEEDGINEAVFPPSSADETASKAGGSQAATNSQRNNMTDGGA